MCDHNDGGPTPWYLRRMSGWRLQAARLTALSLMLSPVWVPALIDHL